MSFVVYALAVWRVSSLIVREDGPFKVFERVRTLAGVDRPGEVTGLAQLFSCVWCMSIWVAAAIWAIGKVRPAVVTGLAASALAILVDVARGKLDESAG